ncbi:MAG: non-canonical purine NTP diphosphatase [Bacteroidia bacterium]|nr:non-canonical purine NTP diphosphatase [Bacteroidia bacterium]
MLQLVFATQNAYKLKEIQQQLGSAFELVSMSDINCTTDIEETGETFAQNAQLKTNYLNTTYGLNCFGDDSGLCVETLNNAPGVHSARYAGEHKNDDDNMNKLLLALQNCSNRNAYFKTVISLNYYNKNYLFEGEIHGKIITEKRGTNGFGYDPIFVPNGYNKTFAELESTTKNIISHRAIAFKKLIQFLQQV